IDKFKPEHAPFVKRTVGPYWFVEEFPVLNLDLEEEVNDIWTAYLDPTVISCRIGTQASEYGLVGYQPNLVSRQFGFSQFRPRSMYLRKKNIVLGTTVSAQLYNDYMVVANSNVYGLEPFDYNISHFCTQEFANWWNQYYSSRSLGDKVLISRLESGFTQPQIDQIERQVRPKVTKKQLEEALENIEGPSKPRKRTTDTVEAGPSKKQR
ncbi:hypothetical protein A2U01_0027141, partial [Trifolium medium]|nr:hypothetical protein [Trifolium medium]